MDVGTGSGGVGVSFCVAHFVGCMTHAYCEIAWATSTVTSGLLYSLFRIYRNFFYLF